MNWKVSPNILIFAVLASVALVHIGVLGHSFLYHWDDHWVVLNSYTEAGLSWENLKSVLTTFYKGQYAPLNELSYITAYSISGFNPFVFHLFNLVWHIANVALVYVFTKKLLAVIRKSESVGNEYISLLTAFLFGVNPVVVEPVSWVSASKLLNYSFFYLFAMIVYLRYLKSNRVIDFVLVLILFVLSFGCKEQAVVLPLTLLLIDFVAGRKGKVLNMIYEKLPFFILAAVFSVITVLSQGENPAMPHYNFFYRIIFAFYSLFEYFIKVLIPVNLCYIYPFPCGPKTSMPICMYIFPLIIATLAFVVYKFRHERILVFGTLFFVINLLTALHIVSMSRYVVTADRYVYLSVPGIMLIVAWLAVKYAKRFKIIIPAMILYAGYFVGYTILYTQQWRDSDTLKSHVREVLDERHFKEINKHQ